MSTPSAETVSLFRAVTAAEREDILRRGGFGVPFGQMESKQFVTSLEDVHFFGSEVVKRFDHADYFVVEIRIKAVLLADYHFGQPDGVPVYTIYANEFRKFNHHILEIIWR